MRRILLLSVAVFLLDAYFLQKDETSNSRVRLALARAIVTEGTLSIDSFQEGIWDKAYFEGHYYSDKAPLASFLALPSSYVIQTLHIADLSPRGGSRGEDRQRYLCRLDVISFATALSLYLFGGLLQREGFSRRTIFAVCLLGWFGTPLLPYGTVFFGHNLTAALVVGGMLLLERRPAAAGLMMGLAVTSDYQALVIALVFGAFAGGAKRTVRYALGATAPLLLLGCYHAALFGNPFVIPVRYEVKAAVHNMTAPYQSGLYGFSLPKPQALWLLLLSPAKGLFALSPFLLALPLATPPRRPAARRLFFASLAASILYLLFIASAPSYHGGFSFGPRLLIPILPCLFFILAPALEKAASKPPPNWTSRTILVGGLIAFAFYFAASATLIAIPYSYRHPLGELLLPRLLSGRLVPNGGRLLGLSGLASLLPILVLLSGLVIAGVRMDGRRSAANQEGSGQARAQ